MDTEVKRFIGYHGTDYNGEMCIIKSKTFNLSNNDNEWLGTGIYFFIDKDRNKAIDNAYKWSTNHKHFSFYSILETIIAIEEDKIANFNNEDWQSLYHDYRDGKIKDTISRGMTVETNKIKFDCEVINDMCKEFGILAIKQQRYISVLEKKGIPKSEIPNCTILCVRESKLIDKNSIRVEKRGKNHG